jgi:hypothetical protein
LSAQIGGLAGLATWQVCHGARIDQQLELPRPLAGTTTEDLTMQMRVTESETIDGPGVLPGLAEKMRGELRKLVGMWIQSRLTTRGAIIKAETSLPPDAPAWARSTMDSMQGSLGRGAVLPAEAIGVGARWETESDLRQNGYDLHQLSRYRVRELVGSRVGLDVEVELTAGAQEIAIPNAGGMTVQLESLRGTGSGIFNLDVGSVVPRLSWMSLDTEMSMRIPAGGRTLAMSTRMKMAIDMHAGR